MHEVSEREREREQLDDQFSENQPGVRTVSSGRTTAWLQPTALIVLRMKQSDFFKMQKLNFDREKHRGYWNIGET